MFVPGALSASAAVPGQVMTAAGRFLDHVVWPACVLPDQSRLVAPAAAAQDFLGDSRVLRTPPQVPSPSPACSRSPERPFDAAPVLRPWTTRTGRASAPAVGSATPQGPDGRAPAGIRTAYRDGIGFRPTWPVPLAHRPSSRVRSWPSSGDRGPGDRCSPRASPSQPPPSQPPCDRSASASSHPGTLPSDCCVRPLL
jgi:hypothetical protein